MLPSTELAGVSAVLIETCIHWSSFGVASLTEIEDFIQLLDLPGKIGGNLPKSCSKFNKAASVWYLVFTVRKY